MFTNQPAVGTVTKIPGIGWGNAMQLGIGQKLDLL
jgi:hypothetical protein